RRLSAGRGLARPDHWLVHLVLPGPDRALAGDLAPSPSIRRGGDLHRRERLLDHSQAPGAPRSPHTARLGVDRGGDEHHARGRRHLPRCGIQDPDCELGHLALVDPQHSTPAMIAKARHRLGVDRPITTQYAKFVWRALHGDFGVAYEGLSFNANDELVGTHVGSQVIRAAAVTGWLALGGVVLVIVLAIPAAMLAASRAGSWLDKTLLAVTLIGISTHPIVIGVVLQTFAGN